MKRNAAILSVLSLTLGLIIVQVSYGQLENYSQTFEGLQINDEAALADDGWLVGANVFDNGVFLYNYFGDENGPFPAPNIDGGSAFSSIATGAGGDNQGLQYLNVFSDYNNMDHGQGFLIDGSVYRNGIIGAADLNQTFRFEFDFRRSDDPFGPGGATTTNAFIRILSPAPDFFLIFEDTIDTTGATFDWVEGTSLEFTVADDLEGFLFQVGFNSQATLFEPSGIYYDNISFGLPADCLVGDLNGDGMVTLLDVAPFVAAISDSETSCPADINGDGTVDLLDVNPFILLLSGG